MSNIDNTPNAQNAGTSAEKAIKETVIEIVKSFEEQPEGQGVKTLVIRTDKPKIVYEKQKVAIAGILDTPLRYLKKRISQIKDLDAHIVVSRDNMTIKLTTNAEDTFKHLISGELQLDPRFVKWGINSGTELEPANLGEFIKMNRSDFESREVAMRLTTEMKNFKAKIDKIVELSNNDRGDVRALRQQAVTTNLPEKFFLVVPIFKGYPAVKIEVEIYINPNGIQCSLHSPEVNDEIQSIRDRAIDEQLKGIEEIAPGILIIEE